MQFLKPWYSWNSKEFFREFLRGNAVICNSKIQPNKFHFLSRDDVWKFLRGFFDVSSEFIYIDNSKIFTSYRSFFLTLNHLILHNGSSGINPVRNNSNTFAILWVCRFWWYFLNDKICIFSCDQFKLRLILVFIDSWLFCLTSPQKNFLWFSLEK